MIAKATVDTFSVASRLLSEALRDADVSITAAARALGRSHQYVSKLVDPDQDRVANLSHVLSLPREARRALVRLLAAVDGDRVVPEEQATGRLDDVAALAEITRRLGAVLGEESAAQRDSLYDRQEAASLREAYADVVQLGMERIARLEQAERAGVDAVRGPLAVAQ